MGVMEDYVEAARANERTVVALGKSSNRVMWVAGVATVLATLATAATLAVAILRDPPTPAAPGIYECTPKGSP